MRWERMCLGKEAVCCMGLFPLVWKRRGSVLVMVVQGNVVEWLVYRFVAMLVDVRRRDLVV